MIRQATLEDCSAMSRVLAMTWKVTYKGIFSQRFLQQLNEKTWINRLTHQISTEDTLCLVAEIDGEIVGCLGAGRNRWDTKGAEIFSLYVLPSAWGQGIGTQLVTNALTSLKSQHDNVSVLAVMGNKRALAFYQKMGFVDTNKVITSEIDGGKFQSHYLNYQLKID